MKERTITAIILIVILVPFLLLGGWWTVALTTIAVFGGVYEILKVRTDKNWPIPFYIVTFGGTFMCLFWNFLIGFYLHGTFALPTTGFVVQINVNAIAIFLISLLLVESTTKGVKVADVFYVFTMVLFLCITGQGIIALRGIGLDVIVYIILCTIACDTFALFGGRYFGTRKLAPIISPKKTWEGLIVGVMLTSIIGVIYHMVFSLGDFPNLLIAVVSALLAIGASIGDLVFSSIKRNYNIKDFGTLFPGHGGILDRLDSISFNVVIFIAIWAFVTNGVFVP